MHKFAEYYCGVFNECFNLKFTQDKIAIAAEAPINPLKYVQNVSFPYMNFQTMLQTHNSTTS
jgi:hypothetical protein